VYVLIKKMSSFDPAIIIEKSLFDNKAEYHSVVRDIYNFISNITSDIEVHVFRDTKIDSFRGKNTNVRYLR